MHSRQKMVPAFDIQKSETIKVDELSKKEEYSGIERITGRWPSRSSQIKRFPLVFTDLSDSERENKINLTETLFPHASFYHVFTLKRANSYNR